MAENHTQYEHRNEPRDRSIRVGDRDREQVAGILREQHVAGRLDTDELQERIDRCYSAKTYRELDELIADLPGPEPTPVGRRPWRWSAVALVPLVIAAVALSGGRLLWLAIPLFFFVVKPLLWRSAYGRPGWGWSACGARHSPRPRGYV